MTNQTNQTTTNTNEENTIMTEDQTPQPEPIVIELSAHLTALASHESSFAEALGALNARHFDNMTATLPNMWRALTRFARTVPNGFKKSGALHRANVMAAMDAAGITVPPKTTFYRYCTIGEFLHQMSGRDILAEYRAAEWHSPDGCTAEGIRVNVVNSMVQPHIETVRAEGPVTINNEVTVAALEQYINALASDARDSDNGRYTVVDGVMMAKSVHAAFTQPYKPALPKQPAAVEQQPADDASTDDDASTADESQPVPVDYGPEPDATPTVSSEPNIGALSAVWRRCDDDTVAAARHAVDELPAPASRLALVLAILADAELARRTEPSSSMTVAELDELAARRLRTVTGNKSEKIQALLA